MVGGVVKRYFTVEMANEMIPELERAFGRMMQFHALIRASYTTLEEVGFAPEADDFDLNPEGAAPEVVQELASLRTLIDALRADLLALQGKGCVVKSVESGLVDWPARVQDREIYLCWKLGEKEIGFWHEVDAGFAGRRPVTDLGSSSSAERGS